MRRSSDREGPVAFPCWARAPLGPGSFFTARLPAIPAAMLSVMRRLGARTSRALVAAALALAACHEQPARASYRVDLRSAAQGEATVELRLGGAPEGVELASLLGDTLAGVSDLRIEDAAGKPVPITLAPPPAGSKDGITRYVTHERSGSDLVARYRLRVTPCWPESGAQELRRSGAIGSAGVALSLPSMLLVPSCALDESELAFDLPDGWVVVEKPSSRGPVSASELWRPALVAGDFRLVRKLIAPKLELSVFQRAQVNAEELVTELAGGIAGILGEPRAPVHLVIAPWEPAASPA